jgi:hypothetical protein
MAQSIILKRSSQSGKTPTTSSLNLGELAVNTYDGKVFLKKSGSVESIQTLVTTDSVTTGSISLTGDLTVLGAVNAKQFNINVISSSVLYQSGSSKFGDSMDDIMGVTGSLQLTGSLVINGTSYSAATSGTSGAQGRQGPQGNQGTQGTQGFQGTQGNQGPQGNQGTQGTQGFQGNQGPQGNQGTQGNQGPQGNQGANGSNGTQGNQGPQGNQGTQGTQGFQGRQGPQGNQGANGSNGTQGNQGPQGNQGATGALSVSGTTDNGLVTLNGSSPNVTVESNLSFDGSNLNITGSVYVSGAISASTFNGVGNLTDFSSSLSSRIISASSGGNNTFDFNLEPSVAGTVAFVEDLTSNTQIVAQTNSMQVIIASTTYLSMSANTMNVTTGSITSNYMHLAKYINNSGDLDFNI